MHHLDRAVCNEQLCISVHDDGCRSVQRRAGYGMDGAAGFKRLILLENAPTPCTLKFVATAVGGKEKENEMGGGG